MQGKAEFFSTKWESWRDLIRLGNRHNATTRTAANFESLQLAIAQTIIVPQSFHNIGNYILGTYRTDYPGKGDQTPFQSRG